MELGMSKDNVEIRTCSASHDSCSCSWFCGLLFGVLGGLTLGILTAPSPGTETRGKLREKVRVLPDRVSELVDDTLDVYATGVNYLQVAMEEQSQRVKHAVAAGKLAAAKKREELEMGGQSALPFQHR
jgi:gas vesicle protein